MLRRESALLVAPFRTPTKLVGWAVAPETNHVASKPASAGNDQRDNVQTFANINSFLSCHKWRPETVNSIVDTAGYPTQASSRSRVHRTPDLLSLKQTQFSTNVKWLNEFGRD